MYYKSWFTRQSVAFWKHFLEDFPADGTLYLENVMEDSPELLCEIAGKVDAPRFRLCLDVGHAHAELSHTPVLTPVPPYLGRVHLHANRGKEDLHLPLGEGTLPAAELLQTLEEQCPQVTYTIENIRPGPSVTWPEEHGFLEDDASWQSFRSD